MFGKAERGHLHSSKENLPPHTVNLRPVFEIEDEAVAHNFGEQMEEICLADSGGPGLGSVRQSLFVLIDPA